MFGSHEKPQHDTFEEHSTSSGSTGSRLAIIGLVLAIVAAGSWFAIQKLGSDDSAADGPRCETTIVTVAAAPAMADLVQKAADSLSDNGQCIEVEVTTATVAEIDKAQDDVREGEADVFPDLWVPDSPSWQRVLTEAGRDGKILDKALASTPTAFAGGRDDYTPASWLEVLDSQRLVMSDPKASGASAMALLAPFAEGDSTGAESAIVPVAQAFGDDVASEDLSSLTVDNIEAGSNKLLPVTERDFLIAQRGNSALQWVAPETGVALLQFPLVQPSPPGQATNVSGEALDVAGRTGDRLAQWFTGGDGTAEIAVAQLRGPDGTVLADYANLSTEEQLPTVEKAQVDAVMKSWNSLTVPSSILTLVETSASMGEAFGDTTRIQLAVDASLTALEIFPDAVRLGLWQYSTEIGPKGEDYEELAPLDRLDHPVGKGLTQIDLVTEAAESLPGATRGGAGLYDSILAAYQETAREYNTYYSNALVVFSDGPNDDENSISLAELKRELKALYNPERPVRIILIGLTDSADMAALQEIASAADQSAAFQVLKEGDILTVLASALLSRE